jgi:transcriptional antiterminator
MNGETAPALPLDTRQARIVRRLLDTLGPTSVEDLASELKLTERMVRYSLEAIDGLLVDHGLRLARRRGVGIWIEGPPGARADLGDALAASAGPAVLDPVERRGRILLALLVASPEPVRSEAIEARLDVSRATIRRDMREVESWLEGHRLHLRRIPGRGIRVVGSEVDIRGSLLALVLEIAPPAVLVDAPSPGGPDDPTWPTTDPARYAASLGLPAFRAILRDELHDVDDGDPTVGAVALYLAIAVDRIRGGRAVRLGGGRLRSLLDHPASASAGRIAQAVEAAIGVHLGRTDVAAITESLLGLTQLVDLAARPEAMDARYIDRLIAAAAERIHPSLAADEQLRLSLTEHVRRLQVRLRFGLPISNPLQHEVRRRYPDVFRAAGEILAEVGPVGEAETPIEEVGLLTMYLAGSLERHRLHATVRVTVVCPAGMATAWILVSRIVAEFPQIEVVRVVSKAGYEGEAGEAPDLVVSTIPLDDGPDGPPTLVVSPLLHEADVRRIGRAVASLGQAATNRG